MIDHKLLFHSFIDEQILNLDTSMLEDFSYVVRDKDAGRSISNYGGWQSNDLDIKIPELTNLVHCIFHNTERLILKYDLPKTYHIDPLWININGKRDFNQLHEHPGSIFGGIYYINAPKDCGDLVMINPVNTHQHYIDPRSIENFNEFNSFSWKVTPATNKLVMFPAWVPHFTFPNESDEDRISIAFNICCGA
jgi:uncharacterized protein (TIGR02466 family)|tara:strand:+ start:1763 stop:2341 length:579 start_codon:yes stop_codon:yes gene_type:complete